MIKKRWERERKQRQERLHRDDLPDPRTAGRKCQEITLFAAIRMLKRFRFCGRWQKAGNYLCESHGGQFVRTREYIEKECERISGPPQDQLVKMFAEIRKRKGELPSPGFSGARYRHITIFHAIRLGKGFRLPDRRMVKKGDYLCEYSNGWRGIIRAEFFSERCLVEENSPVNPTA